MVPQGGLRSSVHPILVRTVLLCILGFETPVFRDMHPVASIRYACTCTTDDALHARVMFHVAFSCDLARIMWGAMRRSSTIHFRVTHPSPPWDSCLLFSVFPIKIIVIPTLNYLLLSFLLGPGLHSTWMHSPATMIVCDIHHARRLNLRITVCWKYVPGCGRRKAGDISTAATRIARAIA